MTRSISDEQILGAALDVIVQRGYAGATTREIAAAAGINEVTLFRRFGSKDKLLKAVVEQEAEKFAAAGIEYTGDLEADLVRVVRFYQELMNVRGQVIVMLLSEIPRQPELLEIVQTPLSIMGKVLVLLERYQQDGRLIEEPPSQSLAVLLGPLMFLRAMAPIQPEQSNSTVEPAALVRHFLRGRAPQ